MRDDVPDAATSIVLGAVAGDVIGSPYERHSIKHTEFPLFGERSRFTDDTVLTVATAEVLVSGGSYAKAYREWARRYPHAGFGGLFRAWFRSDDAGPINSFGNGSAMRVSPVAFAFDSAEEVMAEAELSASVTHDHPEGIRGAQATALATFLARKRVPKAEIRREIAGRFGYDLSRGVEEIRREYRFDVTCQGSVPQALVAFLDAEDFEGAVRAAVSLGGDADTQAAIAGGAAAAWDGGVPSVVAGEVWRRLPGDMREVLSAFGRRFIGTAGAGKE